MQPRRLVAGSWQMMSSSSSLKFFGPAGLACSKWRTRMFQGRLGLHSSVENSSHSSPTSSVWSFNCRPSQQETYKQSFKVKTRKWLLTLSFERVTNVPNRSIDPASVLTCNYRPVPSQLALSSLSDQSEPAAWRFGGGKWDGDHSLSLGLITLIWAM